MPVSGHRVSWLPTTSEDAARAAQESWVSRLVGRCVSISAEGGFTTSAIGLVRR